MNSVSLDPLLAQAQAAALFVEIGRRDIVSASLTEEAISEAIFALALNTFGTRRHWHRRVVRSGPNTRLPFNALPPDRMVESDDIVSIDLGPVFGEWEADIGRTYVLGKDAAKLKLCSDLELLFLTCREHYLACPDITGAEFYAHVVGACAARGWGFGGAHAGHLVGRFPIATSERNAARNRIRPDNHVPMSAPNIDGSPRTWILEIHLLDPTGAFGGFFEDLLTA